MNANGSDNASTEHTEWALAAFCRLSGLTRKQLTTLFKVSHPSLCAWLNGSRMTPAHEAHLQLLLATIRLIDRGSPAENRVLLLTPRDDGSSPFDLLMNGEYERVLALVGPGQVTPQTPRQERLAATYREERDGGDDREDWFRSQVEAGLREADDPQTQWVSHDEAKARWRAQRDKLINMLG